MKEPESMEDLLYFTNRTVDNGSIKAWVCKIACPECGKAKMGKPVEKGKVKLRAPEYLCPECGYSEEKKEHEEARTLEAKYTCPECGKAGEGTADYKRKAYKGVPSYIVLCQHCNAKIAITKKMKALKKK